MSAKGRPNNMTKRQLRPLRTMDTLPASAHQVSFDTGLPTQSHVSNNTSTVMDKHPSAPAERSYSARRRDFKERKIASKASLGTSYAAMPESQASLDCPQAVVDAKTQSTLNQVIAMNKISRLS